MRPRQAADMGSLDSISVLLYRHAPLLAPRILNSLGRKAGHVCFNCRRTSIRLPANDKEPASDIHRKTRPLERRAEAAGRRCDAPRRSAETAFCPAGMGRYPRLFASENA